MRKKLGLFDEAKEDEYLIEGLLNIMEKLSKWIIQILS